MGIFGLRTRALGGAALADYLYNERKEEDSVDTFKLPDRAEVWLDIALELWVNLLSTSSNTFPVPTCRARVRSGGQEVGV